MIFDGILVLLIIALAIIVCRQRNKEAELEADNDKLRDTIIKQDLKIEDKDRRIAMLENYPEPELHYEGVPVYNVSFKVQCLDDTMNETSLKLRLRAMSHSQFKDKAIKITKLRIDRK